MRALTVLDASSTIGTTHLHTFEHVAAVLEAGRGGVDRQRCVWFNFGRGPSKGGMVRDDGHVVAKGLLKSQSKYGQRVEDDQ